MKVGILCKTRIKSSFKGNSAQLQYYDQSPLPEAPVDVLGGFLAKN